MTVKTVIALFNPEQFLLSMNKTYFYQCCVFNGVDADAD